MQILGKGTNSFCYRLKRESDNLGSIYGLTASKCGVFYFKETGEYKYTKIWGDHYEEAYLNIRSAIVDLIKAGKDEDIYAIISNKISPMFKGKILSTYYPDKYLNIFSDEHLNHYLTFFGLDFNSLDNSVSKRDIDSFAYFLYSVYPKASAKNNDVLFLYTHPGGTTLQELVQLSVNFIEVGLTFTKIVQICACS